MSENVTRLGELVTQLDEASKAGDNKKADQLLDKITEITDELKLEAKKFKSESKETKKENRVPLKQKFTSILDKIRNKTINKVFGKSKYKLRHVSPSNLQLLKQKIKFRDNTLSVRRLTQNLHIASLNVQNKTLEGVIGVKETAKKVKSTIVDKVKLAKLKIKTKYDTKKQTIKRVSREKVASFKSKLKNIKLNVSTQIGARALYASEKLEDKMLFLKDRISRKVQSKKNIIARKTGMQIALFKDSLKARKQRRIERKVSKMDDRIGKNSQRIEELKNQRKMLLDQLTNRPDEMVEEGVKSR